MMKDSEQTIKEAFDRQDSKAEFPQKDELWNRLDRALPRQRSFVLVWKVAAIFICFLLIASVYAGLAYRNRTEQKIEELHEANQLLENKLDSLLALPPEVKTEVKVVEKLVYRDREVAQKKDNQQTKEDFVWQKRYNHLQDSVTNLLASQQTFYQTKIQQLEQALVAQGETSSKRTEAVLNNENEPFVLKSNRIDLSKTSQPASIQKQEIELQIFKKNFFKNKNDLNRTIFK